MIALLVPTSNHSLIPDKHLEGFVSYDRRSFMDLNHTSSARGDVEGVGYGGIEKQKIDRIAKRY